MKNLNLIKNLCLFTLSAFCCWYLLCYGQTAKAVEQPPTINEILDGIKKMERGLFQNSTAFLVVCVRTKCDEVTPTRYSGGYLNTRFAIGKRQNEWYSLKQFLKIETKKDQKEGTLVLDDKDEVFVPSEPKLTVIKNNMLLEWNQTGRPLITLENFNTGRNIFGNIDYFRHLGLNVGKQIAESVNVDFEKLVQLEQLKDYLEHPFLPDFLEKNKANYHVLPSQEKIDGFPCWVVEYPNMDKFWIDTLHGFVIRKRIYHWGVGQPRMFCILNQEFKEVKPELWFPQKQIVEKYASIKSENKNLWDKIACRLHYQLETIAFDTDVSADLFNIVPEPGTYRSCPSENGARVCLIFVNRCFVFARTYYNVQYYFL
jgi:hypothetical protein